MQTTPRLVELSANSPILYLSANKYHTVALNAMGECFVWGFGKGGRLGTGNEFDHIEPVRLESLRTTPLKRVAAGENHTLALSWTGQVFSWGSNSFGQLGYTEKCSSSQSRLLPKRVDALRSQEVAEIAASGCHSAAIDDHGVLYTWGSNRRGQLGRKEGCATDQADSTPRSVDALCPRHPMCVVYGNYDAVRAEKVATSDWHTCVVLRCARNGRSFGQIWQFGYGSFRPSRVVFPSAVKTSGSGALTCDTWIPNCKQRDLDIVEVSCAVNHSIALSACGSVFTWGHNVSALSHKASESFRPPFSACKASPTTSPSAPQKVSLASYGPVINVCASQDHCAVVTEQGDLVTWGCGQQGVLGHGRGNTWQLSPKRVAGVKKAVMVATGHQHTAVLIAPVRPSFKSGIDAANQKVVPPLLEIVERTIASYVDVANCIFVWQVAERHAAFRLLRYCAKYMQINWDAVLDTLGRVRMETLCDIMLPLVEPDPENDLCNVNLLEEHRRKKRVFKQPTKSLIKPGLVSSVGAFSNNETCGCSDEKLVTPKLSDATSLSSVGSNKAERQRRFRKSKYFPITSLSTEEIVVHPPRDHTRISHPWGSVANSTPVDPATSQINPVTSPRANCQSATRSSVEAFPLLNSSLCRLNLDDNSSVQLKGRIGSHSSASSQLSSSILLSKTDRYVLGCDGAEYQKATAFSLEAYLKKTGQRSHRGKDSASVVPNWCSQSSGSMAEQKPHTKTLKEIQDEEEATAAREREAKAHLRGITASVQPLKSTINSWGLFRSPKYVSLAHVQKLQEEYEFVEQQREMLADIERRQVAKAKKTLGGRKLIEAKASKKTSRGKRRGHKEVNANAGRAALAPSTIVADGDGHSQSKQNRQKKTKKRMAARKAAGETFAENVI